MSSKILEEELRRPTVFRDPNVLLPDYIPPSIVHREEEQRWLARVYRPLLTHGTCQHTLIVGEIGVGKTVLAIKFGTAFEEIARGKGRNVDFVHINCRLDKTIHAIYGKLVQKYNPRWPYHGLPPEKLLDMVLMYLETHDRYLLLALDELDYFIKINGSELIYALTRAAEERGKKSRISMIGIARDPGFIDKLDQPTRSTFIHNMLRLSGYNAEELKDIINQRLELAFKPGAVAEEVVEMVAEIAARYGNARFALELLWRAGHIADASGSKAVLPEHVREAKSDVYPEVRREAIEQLGVHEKLLLLAIARKLKISGSVYVLTGDVRESYKVVCEEYGEKPKAPSKVWECMRRLASLGIIDVKPSGAGHRGRSSKVSIPDVSVIWLEKEIEKLLSKQR
ncbi:MAG: ORC1-type DNA replication protein [Candidatus Hadarchaeales archaeon]